MLELNVGPPLGRMNIGCNDHNLRIELDLAVVYRNTELSCVDELVKVCRLHPVPLEFVNDDDVVLVVTVPVLAGSFRRGKGEDVA